MRQKIRDILLDCGIREDDLKLENMMESEAVDSLTVAEMIMGLEDEFGIVIDGEDIVPENFSNISSIEKLVKKYIECNDYEDKIGRTQDEIRWDVVARGGENPIEQSGWKSSFTQIFFSEKEMEEYVENIYLKLAPYINMESIVLEVGVGSGIIARKMASYVKKYIGTDISGMTLEKTEVQLIQEGYTNIELLHMDALEIEKLKNNKISIIFMSSVAQYLKNYETFKKFLEIACSVVDDGIIFIGDVPDLQKKLDFIKEVEAANGKMDEAALWYSRQFMRSMEEEIPDIQSVEISDKQGWTIANELTKYRYDVLYKVKKHEK